MNISKDGRSPKAIDMIPGSGEGRRLPRVSLCLLGEAMPVVTVAEDDCLHFGEEEVHHGAVAEGVLKHIGPTASAQSRCHDALDVRGPRLLAGLLPNALAGQRAEVALGSEGRDPEPLAALPALPNRHINAPFGRVATGTGLISAMAGAEAPVSVESPLGLGVERLAAAFAGVKRLAAPGLRHVGALFGGERFPSALGGDLLMPRGSVGDMLLAVDRFAAWQHGVTTGVGARMGSAWHGYCHVRYSCLELLLATGREAQRL
jgi:hypothetical protein